jgi:GxxExxY protein
LKEKVVTNYNERGDDRGRGGRRGRGVPLSELDPALTEISHTVIGCARDVHVDLGPGYPKSIYMEAMKLELKDADIAYRADEPVDVYLGDDKIGQVTADLLIADRFIVEIGDEPGPVGSFERSALRAKLRAADLELGLIINFSGRLLKDGLVRVLNPDKLNAMREGDSGGDDDSDESAEVASGGSGDSFD